MPKGSIHPESLLIIQITDSPLQIITSEGLGSDGEFIVFKTVHVILCSDKRESTPQGCLTCEGVKAKIAQDTVKTGKEDFIQGSDNRGERPELNLNSTP